MSVYSIYLIIFISGFNKVTQICYIKIVNNFSCFNFDYIYVYLLVNLAVEEYDIFPALILNACIKFRNLI